MQLSVFGLVSFAFQLGCWAGIARFSLLGGWTVRSCGYVAFCYGYLLGLPLTAPFQQFRWMQAHFTNCAGCKNTVKLRSCSRNCKKTGIPYRLRLSNDTDYPTQAIQFFKQPKLLTIQTIPYRYQPKQTIHPRSAQILRKTIAKHHVAAGTNSPSPQ